MSIQIAVLRWTQREYRGPLCAVVTARGGLVITMLSRLVSINRYIAQFSRNDSIVIGRLQSTVERASLFSDELASLTAHDQHEAGWPAC